ncbi:MAG: polyribonucleotide nucleotidyltransferase, partial [Acidobacteriota bacterium]|nr:polyribonucleotide nucleotidyltransferase [Acidobacteriota bacterium]
MEKSKLSGDPSSEDQESLAKIKKELSIDGKKLSIELDTLASQANGSVVVRLGDTVVLATAVISKEVREGIDYLPLLVDYEEKLYAAGKIKGSRWVKREGRPTDEAILTSRLIDRSLRPFFDERIRNDIQIIPTVLSIDEENDPDIISVLASSVALLVSDIPFEGPIAAVRVGKVGKDFIINPSYKEREEGDLDLVIVGNGEKVAMLEGGAKEISEELVLSASEFGLKYVKKIIELEKELQDLIKPEKSKGVVLEEKAGRKITEKVEKYVEGRLDEALFVKAKQERTERLEELKNRISEQLTEESETSANDIGKVFDQIVGKRVREVILKEEKRVDGRKLDEIRPISVKAGFLPRTHGSALFTRGETQSLTVATLGSPDKTQLLDTMEAEGEKRFIHYYNFPPFCSGEVKPLRGPSRRETGHGALAERALAPVIPSEDEFPYTILVVSEILSSNGSTSMAATCGSSLALMDAGVPIKRPVAGISIGLIAEDDKNYKLLT